MHISTTALYVILLSILGLSKKALAVEKEDAFGLTKYGLGCFGRIYTKPLIYRVAKRYCDIIQSQPDMRLRRQEDVGYRKIFHVGTAGDVDSLLAPSHDIIPILQDGRLYPFEKKLKNMGPGPDRLVIDEKCNIVGAFTDFNFQIDTDDVRVGKCIVFE